MMMIEKINRTRIKPENPESIIEASCSSSTSTKGIKRSKATKCKVPQKEGRYIVTLPVVQPTAEESRVERDYYADLNNPRRIVTRQYLRRLNSSGQSDGSGPRKHINLFFS
ncbi:hypothetical protein CEXT_433201 [Caerostris extrusa]|uniref:Uncharacterized protein n=1 Tax=Caerostris extrusa TaxID=172846 RepID=A0AAV4XYL6_CAEEX|nr:hypothetical protein CEXT_433201 [Caerostris extrusa]